MKVKTIVHGNPGEFDNQVNTMLEKGYLLEHRGLIGPTGIGEIKHYAQMTLPDPAPEHEHEHEHEPVEIDGIQALHIVKAACLAHKGPCNDCPMTNWCEQLQHGGDPTDWVLPEV